MGGGAHGHWTRERFFCANNEFNACDLLNLWGNGYGLDLDLHIMFTNHKFNDPRKEVV